MIRPLYKSKGSVDDPGFWRYHLTQLYWKLFTAIINDSESAGILGETLDHILVLDSLVEWHLHKKKDFTVLLLIIKKASDLVDGSHHGSN